MSHFILPVGKARQRFPPSLDETVETLQSLFGLINKPTGAGGSNGGGVGIQRLQRNCSVSLPLGPHGLFSLPLREPLPLSADHLFLLLDQHHKPRNSSCLQALPIRSARASTSKENLCPLVSHLSGASGPPTSQTGFPLLRCPSWVGDRMRDRLYGTDRSRAECRSLRRMWEGKQR